MLLHIPDIQASGFKAYLCSMLDLHMEMDGYIYPHSMYSISAHYLKIHTDQTLL